MSSERSTTSICFIGLGIMGAPMAGHLAEAGYEVAVWNRTAAKSTAWLKEHAGRVLDTIDQAKGSDVIVSCVGDDSDLEAIYLGEGGLFNQLKAGTLIIDHTTASADVARRLNEAAVARNLLSLDAPVSGGQQGAINGRLTAMCGGSSEAYGRAEPIIQSYAATVRHLGPAGSGQLTKMVNQIAIAGLVEGLSEAIHFAQSAGLDPTAVVDVISKGAAQSWQMDNRHTTMIEGEFEHGFAVDLMRKDLGICLAEARRNGAQLPVAALVDQFYAEVQRSGGGRWDTSSLLTRLRIKKD